MITGIRRCGKSAVLNQVMSEIKKESNNIIYLNFEKTSDLLKVNNSAGLIKYINENKKDGKCYIFLDEIQEVDNWQIAVKDLRLDNNSIFITGSNSKLLSREILSLLSGRFINIQIRPFIYNEIVQLLEESKKEATITDYLIWGGFPGRFQYESLDAQKDYLFDLMGTIVYNDLRKRYKIKKEVVFRKIVQFILRSNSRIISSRNIQKHIKNECESISLNTVLKYIEYLKEAYIIDEIPQYSSKTKKELSYYYKVYDEDVCFNSLNVIDGRYDLEHNLENIVYNELIYRGYKINVFNNGTKEIDFYAIKNGKEYFIQVAYSLVNEKTYEREFSAFKNLDYSVKKIIISMDDVDYFTSLVKHISLKNFLKANDFE